MKKVLVLVIMLAYLMLTGCTSSNSGIDIKKLEDNYKNNDQRAKYNEQARKSIFPNMKSK